ncbi:MAG: response regulator [Gammaproteobacteria bacterium]|nr:response regulator [Gammaproteobacteria bacterium]
MSADSSPPPGTTLLLVEDNRLVRNTLVSMLGGLGYRVLAAEQGAAAREILEGTERIDVLFTDLRLPAPPDGAELARIARELRPSIRVLITSGMVAESALAPGDHFLMKPYDFDELRTMLAALSRG